VKIRFNGYKDKAPNKGCGVCSGKKVSNVTYHRAKTIVFPSGMTRRFIMGQDYVLADDEVEFLMNLQHTLGSHNENMFQIV
jgi:hypothetical protein